MESKLEFPQSAILTPYNYFEWKPKIQLHLRSRGLFRITMETEVEPTSAVEKSRYFNRMDEAFGILCFSISPELLFHVESCSTPNEVWKILEELFGKQNEMLRMVEDSIAIYRNHHESFSSEPEDPHVASLYATNYVQGLQETDGGDPIQLEGTIRGTVYAPGCANVACTGNEPKKDNVAAMAESLATGSGQAQAMNPALTSMGSLNSPLQTLNPPLNPGLSSTLNPALSNSLLGAAPPLHHSGPFPAFYDQHPQPPPQHSQPLYSQSRSDYEPVTRSFKGLSGPLPSDVAAEPYNVLNGAMCGISAKFKPPWPLDHLLAALAWAAPTWQVVPTRSQIPLVSFKEEWKRSLAMASPRRTMGRPRPATALELIRVCRDLQSKFEQVTLPLLIIHGGDDVICDPYCARALYDRAKSEDKTLRVYEGMWHQLVGEPKEKREGLRAAGWQVREITAVCSKLNAYDCQGGDCVYEMHTEPVEPQEIYGRSVELLLEISVDRKQTVFANEFSKRSQIAGLNQPAFVLQNILVELQLFCHQVQNKLAALMMKMDMPLGLPLGEGAGTLSFTTQLGTQTGRRFSYCMVDRASEFSGTLEFRPESVPVEIDSG